MEILGVDPVKIGVLAGRIARDASSAGYELRISIDFKKLEKEVDLFDSKITPHFATAMNTFFWDEALWIGAYKDAKCVGMVALKLQRLGAEDLISYSERYWKQTYSPGSKTKLKLAKQQKRSMKGIKGNLVYGGEFRVLDGEQNQGLGAIISNYAKAVTFLKWPQTDYLYILTKAPDTNRGLATQIGMTIQIQNYLNWKVSPSQAEPYYFDALPRQHFLDWVDDYQDQAL